MKKIYFVLSLLILSFCGFSQTLYDSYTDGDYTANPVWSGTANWTIVANSDVAAGATGSNTLRLNSPAVAATDYLSSQIGTWGVSQEWGFFMGRRAQAATAANQMYVWLYANETNLNSATVDGYRIAFGDDAGGDNIRLEYIVNGAVSATVITSTGSTTNAITDFGFLVRVTRSSTGVWEIFTSTLPTANGTGAIATDIPSAANTPTSQGTGTENTIVPASNGYIGLAALHSTGGNAIVGAEFDQIYFTPTLGGTPTINVTPASLTGFQSLSGVPTAEQQYTVDGSNLTADITITPPVGFQIATVTGGPYTTNPASITLTQTGGTVNTTTIFVRMNSATLGLNTGNITHTSTGANNPNVSLTGKVLAAEPTTQGAIAIGTVTNSTIQVTFTPGDGAKQILAIHALTPVANDPVDGTTYTANTAYGAGSNLGANTYVVYNGVSGNGGAPVTVTGLTIGTQYYFALYEYNDGGAAGAENYLLPPATANATTLNLVNTYVWTGVNGTLWTDPLNWLPVRNAPATNDSLLFIGPLTVTVTGVPAETIGYLGVSLGADVTLQAAVTTTALNIGAGFTGSDLSVASGCKLNISGTNAYTINILTGNTADIAGSMTISSTASTAHKFTAADANGITFNGATSSFNVGANISGNPFGAGTTGSVIFTNGSTMTQASGANPFATAGGVSTFQTGSLYKVVSATFTPSFSGRTYANVEIDAPGYSVNSVGAGALSIDNLTITNGIQNLNLTAAGISIKGNINIAAGQTLGFNPATANTVTFNGTAAQSINNSGTLTWGALENLTINNAAGVTLNSNITIGAASTLALTNGILKLNLPATMITLSAGTTVTGGNSNASYVDGKVRKIGNTDFTFPIGKSAVGYVPIKISNFAGSNVTDQFDAEYLRGNPRLFGPITDPLIDHISGCDWWTLDRTNGTPTVDVTAYWNANSPCGGTPYVDNLATLALVHFDGASWNSSSVGFNPPPNGTIAAGDITWPAVTTFSPFALGSTSTDNPLPILINYFTGLKQNNNHLLNWKVTCTNTPRVTMLLERSQDGGRTYTEVNSITATALQCQQPFSYTDANPAKGVNYYRLKLTDADGKITYSTVVSLINGTKGYDVLSIAPNPVINGSFNLKISAAQSARIDVVINDMQGRILQSQSVSLVPGFNQVPVNVRTLATGTYQVSVYTTEGRAAVQRIVVQ